MPDLRELIKTVAYQEPILKIEPYLVNAGQDVMDAWAVVKQHLLNAGRTVSTQAAKLSDLWGK